MHGERRDSRVLFMFKLLLFDAQLRISASADDRLAVLENVLPGAASQELRNEARHITSKTICHARTGDPNNYLQL